MVDRGVSPGSCHRSARLSHQPIPAPFLTRVLIALSSRSSHRLYKHTSPLTLGSSLINMRWTHSFFLPRFSKQDSPESSLFLPLVYLQHVLLSIVQQGTLIKAGSRESSQGKQSRVIHRNTINRDKRLEFLATAKQNFAKAK